MRHLSFEELIDEVRGQIAYDPESGLFTWVKDRGKNKLAGLIAGTVGNHGYIQITINYQRVLAHRLAWAMHYLEDPGDLQIDHINRVRTDNRIVNLRLVDRSENQRNCNLQKNNTSGYRGVTWNRRRNKWQAKVIVRGREHWLGCFSSAEAAAAAISNANLC